MKKSTNTGVDLFVYIVVLLITSFFFMLSWNIAIVKMIGLGNQIEYHQSLLLMFSTQILVFTIAGAWNNGKL